MTVINILRQYPAGSHNTPILHLARREGYRIRTHEYDLLSNVNGVFGNIAFITRALLQMKNEKFVLGAEPFDPLVPLFHRLARRNDVILHTSWPYWETNFVPQQPTFRWQRSRWKRFLQDVRAVGVTHASVESVRRAGASEATHIPHSIDTSIYKPNAGTIECDDPVVLFVGRLEPRKGVAELIELIEDWNSADTQFWFVGDGPLAENIATLETVNDQVKYFGYVSDDQQLADIYASADVFTLPSYRVDRWEELFGIVVIEALACGLPVVATDCVGPAEIIDDGETGYIVDQHDVDKLRNRLERIVNDPKQQAQMSKRAREVTLERYDNSHVADQWQQVLEV